MGLGRRYAPIRCATPSPPASSWRWTIASRWPAPTFLAGTCWPLERKRAYVNDLGYDGALKASAAVVNCGKGAKAPDEWQPPDPAAWCTYAEMWVQVKAKRTLTVTTDEVDILEDMLETCP